MKNGLIGFVALTVAGCAAAATESAAPGLHPTNAGRNSSAVASSAAAAAAPRIEHPPTFHQGYKLTYRSRTSDFVVTYRGEEDGLLVFHYDTREKLPFDYLYTPDMKLAGITNAQMQSRFEPPVGYVDFPLFVGKKWDVTYKGISNSQQNMGETSVEVLAFEPVQVPYGTIDAFRIRVHNTDREVGRMNPYETYWYSPEIGYFVKHDTTKPVYEDPFELISVSK